LKPITILAAASALFLASCATTSTPPATTQGAQLVQAGFAYQAGDFNSLFKAARRSKGLKPLSRSALLDKIAQGHANDMSRNQFFDHVGSNGSTLGQRTRAQGYGFCWVAENISLGRSSEAEVFARWMASPPHYKNMVAGKPTQYGLAVAPGNYRVMVLATPGC